MLTGQNWNGRQIFDWALRIAEFSLCWARLSGRAASSVRVPAVRSAPTLGTVNVRSPSTVMKSNQWAEEAVRGYEYLDVEANTDAEEL